jgi:hypothetical protein
LRAEFLVDAISFTQVQGIPFRAAAMEAAILQQIEGTGDDPPGPVAVGQSSPPPPAGIGTAPTNGAAASATGSDR